MILLLRNGLGDDAVRRIEAAVRRAGGDPKRLATEANAPEAACAIDARGADREALGTPEGVAAILDSSAAYRRVARRMAGPSSVTIGRAVIGGGELEIVAGPCAVESQAQLEATARACVEAGARVLRGGAFKPRTSPYSFQGLGEEGLKLLRAVADAHDLGVVTEVLEPDAVSLVAEYADALQIGSRNMQNFPLLKAAGRQRRPVVLKRGMSATLEEWLLAAEYIADAGNEKIVLCERGVRHFDSAARNLLDLSAVPLLRERTHLPIMVDPSHGTGVRAAIPSMALASVAAGADAVMVECHPDPGLARSDGFQALTPRELSSLALQMRRIRVALRS